MAQALTKGIIRSGNDGFLIKSIINHTLKKMYDVFLTGFIKADNVIASAHVQDVHHLEQIAVRESFFMHVIYNLGRICDFIGHWRVMISSVSKLCFWVLRKRNIFGP